MSDDLYTVPTPSDVHCNYCDTVNHRVIIFDDIRTGDWSYIFECRACDRINDEHGNSYERGATGAAATLIWAGAAVAFFGAAFAPIEWKQALILAGLAVSTLITFIAATNWLDENRENQ